MRVKTLNEKKLIRVKNVNGCTNFGGLDLDGKKMYAIKTRSDNQLSTICVYPDYRKNTRRNHKFANCMGHGNDIAYHAGHLYVAPCDSFIEVINVANWTHTRLYCDVFLSAIAHYTGNQFIGLSGYVGNQYKLVILEPQGNRMMVKRSWQVMNPKAAEGFTVSQAMGFKKKNDSIFVVFSRQDFHKNVILRSKIGAANPDYCFESKTCSTGRYELEGIAFTSDGKKIIGSNLPDGQDSTFVAP